MTIFVTGDIHSGAEMARLSDWDATHVAGPGDYLIVAGDFGYPWSFSMDEVEDINWLSSRPYTVLFVDGNHERYDHWEDRPCEKWHGGMTQRLSPGSPIRRLCRGEVFDFDSTTIFTLGGATSIDKEWRIPGADWWPQELPSHAELDHALETLDANNWQVDYVITHTCSTSMLPATLWPKGGWENPDRDYLTDFLDELDQRLAFKRWYYGHFHVDKNVDEKHTVLFQEFVELGGQATFTQ